MIVKGKATVDASGGRDALVSGSPRRQRPKRKTAVRIAGVPSQSCMFYLVSFSQRASLTTSYDVWRPQAMCK